MFLWLADIEPESKQSLVRFAFWLWTALAIIGILFVAMLATILAARHARRMQSARKRRRRGKPIPDAWTEAGRRVMPIRMDEPPPDVIDEPENRS